MVEGRARRVAYWGYTVNRVPLVEECDIDGKIFGTLNRGVRVDETGDGE